MLGPPVSTSFLLFCCFVSLFPVGSLKNKKSSNIAKGVKELMIWGYEKGKKNPDVLKL